MQKFLRIYIWNKLKRSHHITRETCTNIRTMHSGARMGCIIFRFCLEMTQTPHNYQMLSAIRFSPYCWRQLLCMSRIQKKLNPCTARGFTPNWLVSIKLKGTLHATTGENLSLLSPSYKPHMTYSKDPPARHTGATVAQMLYEQPTNFLIGYKAHSVRWNQYLTLLMWQEPETQ